MKLSKVLLLSVLVIPLFGATDCGEGMDPAPPVVTPPAEPKCTAKSCADGCCVKDVCYQSHTRDVCGSFGVECAMCQPLQNCQQQDVSRGFECVADPSSRWSVQPQSAVISLLDPLDGEAWDADSSPPDVVVELGCPIAGSLIPVQTSEVTGYTPGWVDGICTTSIQDLMKTAMTIKVIDVDAFVDDTIFFTEHTFKETDFKNGSVDVPISVDGRSQLRLRLSRAP